MRAALENARTIPEAAASLTAQQQFDHAMAGLVRKIAIPKAAEEWSLNVALLKGATRSWRKTAQHPAILSIALALLVLAGLGIFFFVERAQEFPGSNTARKLLAVANSTQRSDFEPLNTDAINLGDYFFMKFQLEHIDVPMPLADVRATGARVFEDDDGQRVAQVLLAESGMQFFFYPADKSDAAAPSSEKLRWHFLENEGWSGAVEERSGTCLLVALHGDQKELRAYLAHSTR